MPVKFEDILLAFEFANAGGRGESEAFLCKQTGETYIRSEVTGYSDELPDDIEDSEKYLQLPDKRELDLGTPLALDFAAEFLPNDFEVIRRIFSRRGAYAAFKDLLRRK